ncbi:MAG: Do family serine endopeptidase [Terriglobales bacterium]
MKMWVQNLKSTIARRTAVAVLASAVVGALATFHFAESARAASSSVAPPKPAAAALDDNSVAALLSLDRAMETLAARVTPAVVNVTVTSKGKEQAEENGMPDMQQFFGPGSPFGGGQNGRQFRFQMQPQNRVEHGLGSGVIISPDGYIVTNNHVIEGATDIRVTMSNKEVMPAKLIGADPLTDVAVIKVNGTNLPSVPWGNSANLRPGQTVLAFGNPYGFQFTVTRGIISALNRANPDASDRRKPGEFIQTDAAINPGNSGGALVDARGELIGINTFLVSSSGSFSGMGFAIPAQIVEPTVDKLIRFGKVTHGFIGVQISDVTPDNARFFHLNKAAGALVSDVQPESPGAKAGIKTGDVITQLDGKPVTDAGELQMLVGQKQPGDTIHLEVMRDDKAVSVPVTLEELGRKNGSETADTAHKGRWGLNVADLTSDLRDQLQVSNSVHGAVVNDVVPGSPADNAGIGRGDVIMEVDRKPMKSASDVAEALGGVPKGQNVLVLVWSNGGTTFRVLHSPE